MVAGKGRPGKLTWLEAFREGRRLVRRYYDVDGEEEEEPTGF
jgi:hypothetical protein